MSNQPERPENPFINRRRFSETTRSLGHRFISGILPEDPKNNASDASARYSDGSSPIDHSIRYRLAHPDPRRASQNHRGHRACGQLRAGIVAERIGTHAQWYRGLERQN